jgi:hypothetical protein
VPSPRPLHLPWHGNHNESLDSRAKAQVCHYRAGQKHRRWWKWPSRGFLASAPYPSEGSPSCWRSSELVVDVWLVQRDRLSGRSAQPLDEGECRRWQPCGRTSLGVLLRLRRQGGSGKRHDEERAGRRCSRLRRSIRRLSLRRSTPISDLRLTGETNMEPRRAANLDYAVPPEALSSSFFLCLVLLRTCIIIFSARLGPHRSLDYAAYCTFYQCSVTNANYYRSKCFV